MNSPRSERKRLWCRLIWVFLVVALAGVFALPKNPNIHLGSLINKKVDIVQGLDLKGGTHLAYQLDLSKKGDRSEADAIASVVSIIDKRINALGVSEPTIQTATIGKNKAVLIDLPGVTDTQSAIDLIGKTAKLQFYEEGDDPNSPIKGFKATLLGGDHLKKADVAFGSPGGSVGGAVTAPTEPQVSLQFDSQGSDMFDEITKRNVGKPVAIAIDNEVVTAPVVQAEITGGNAVITGKFSVKDARQLSIALNSGALPVPLTLIEQSTIGATLGSETIARSLIAGLVGLLLLTIFMIANYRLAGVLAIISLGAYTLIVIALFKIIPVTLTLAGIAGYILSIGAAVDANILIFERMKEELRAGKILKEAIDNGFRRAWLSIRDSNAASIIISIILIWFGTGIVRGFAITLLVGILVSLFSAITISQTLLKLFLRERPTHV